MRAGFFGSEDEPLFRVHHPPRGASSHVAVLCYPIGHEYFNAHRAFRLLAAQLARSGVHAFRFDYFGSGDSAGADGEGDVDRWTRDVRAAVAEARAVTGATEVTLLGLRFGAALATLAAAAEGGIDRLVLWDPVTRGAPYLEDTIEAASRIDGSDAPDTGAEVMGAAGFPYSTALRASISGVDVRDVIGRLAERVIVAVSAETVHESEWEQAGIDAATLGGAHVAPDGRDWIEPYQPSLIPQGALAWIAKSVAQVPA